MWAEFRQALPLLTVNIEICAWLASCLQFQVKVYFISTFSSFEFQPLSLSLAFNWKVTPETSLAKVSSLLLHKGDTMIYWLGFPVDGESRGDLSSWRSPLKPSYWAKCSYVFPLRLSLSHTCNHFSSCLYLLFVPQAFSALPPSIFSQARHLPCGAEIPTSPWMSLLLWDICNPNILHPSHEHPRLCASFKLSCPCFLSNLGLYHFLPIVPCELLIFHV